MKVMLHAFVLVAGLLGAMPALALTSKKTVTIPAAPQAVWKEIGGFCGIAGWHPAIEKCVLTGRTLRMLSLRGGGTIKERQLSRSDARTRYSYAIVSGPLPVAHYASTIAVTRGGKGSIVTWSGQYDAAGAPAAKAREAIDGVYSSGLQGLADKMAKR